MMELREQIAHAIHRQCDMDLDASWSDWLPEADAVISVLRQQKPVFWGPRMAIESQWDSVTVRSEPANETDIPLFIAPGAQAAVPEEIYRDAMRYRALRNNPAEYPTVFAHPGADDYDWRPVDGADLDAITDELLAAPKPEQPK